MHGMTKNGMAALVEAVRRRHLEANVRVPEPTPEPPPAPAPPGLDDLPPGVRVVVEPFLEHFSVTSITLLPPDAPTPGAIYGAGEAGYRKWRVENVTEQAAEHYRTRTAAPRAPAEPARRAVGECAGKRVEIRRDGTRWLLFTGQPPKRVEWFATPFYDHARRQAEIWYGPPTSGWHFDD
jgi:hypothetical protein